MLGVAFAARGSRTNVRIEAIFLSVAIRFSLLVILICTVRYAALVAWVAAGQRCPGPLYHAPQGDLVSLENQIHLTYLVSQAAVVNKANVMPAKKLS
jgi:hypothetical protein